jgi:hypothetical protein
LHRSKVIFAFTTQPEYGVGMASDGIQSVTNIENGGNATPAFTQDVTNVKSDIGTMTSDLSSNAV